MLNKKKYTLVSLLSLLFCLLAGHAFTAEIHEAARQGDLAKVKELVAKTPSLINEKTENNKTPLHFAAETGQNEIVDFLLGKGADINAKNISDETPLHYAVGYSRVETIKLLLQKGADVNARTTAGDTPLMYVRYMLVKEVAEILLDHGADVKTRNNSGQSLLSAAFARGRPDLVNFLLEKGAEIDVNSDEGTQFLISALNMEANDLINLLLSKNVLENAKSESIDQLLHVTVAGGYKNLIQTVLQKKPTLGSLSATGGTLMHSAAHGNQVEFARSLLEQGADINAVDKYGRTALHISEDWGNTEFISFLRKEGARDLPRPQVKIGEASSEENVKTNTVSISLIANEGFLISSNSKHILVDALFQNPFGYSDTPRLAYEKMKKALDPFNKIDLLLFSHAHRDHYTPEMALEVLKGHPEAAFVGNSVTIGEFKEAAGPDYTKLSPQVKEFNPEWGEILKEKINGIDLKIFPVNHASPGREYVTLAYLMDLDGIKILHLGDIAPPSNVEHFKKYNLENEKIDIAFVDPFFIQDESGQNILRDHIRAKKIILMHMRPNEIDRYAQELGKTYSNIVVFHDPLQKIEFQIFEKE